MFRKALTLANKRQALLSQQMRLFRTSSALGNKFNVYVDGKAVEVDGTYTIF
jgi:hypothetical protein